MVVGWQWKTADLPRREVWSIRTLRVRVGKAFLPHYQGKLDTRAGCRPWSWGREGCVRTGAIVVNGGREGKENRGVQGVKEM